MKKTFAVLMLAAMLLATGCGNKTMDGAKQDAQDAAAKVEQKVDEAKDKADAAKQDAAAKVDEAKQDAAAKVDEVKQDAAAKVDEAKQDAANAMNDAAQKLDNAAANVKGRLIALGDVSPGMTLDAAKQLFGEPTAIDNDEFVFQNGMVVETDPAGKVEEVSITQAGVPTAEGVEVGMFDYALNEHCGPADAIEMDDGAVEYKYFGGDRISKTVYITRGGIITKIKCSIRD